MNKIDEIIIKYAGDNCEHIDLLILESKGYSDAEIARRIGMQPSNFCVWRKRRGYKRVFHSRGIDIGKEIDGDAIISQSEYMRKYRAMHPGKFESEVVRVLNGHEEVSRLIASVCLGRPLRDGEVVHHKDGNRLNNVKENLMLFFSQADHINYERGKYVEDFIDFAKSKVRNAERVARSKEYRKKYYRNHRKEENKKHCDKCGKEITMENYGIKAKLGGKSKYMPKLEYKYICKNCIRERDKVSE